MHPQLLQNPEGNIDDSWIANQVEIDDKQILIHQLIGLLFSQISLLSVHDLLSSKFFSSSVFVLTLDYVFPLRKSQSERRNITFQGKGGTQPVTCCGSGLGRADPGLLVSSPRIFP